MLKRKIKNYRKFRQARVWSNKMLRQYADNFSGVICNVSGAGDDDKEGRKYRSYFNKCDDYYITNYSGGGYRSFAGVENEIFMDLEKELPVELEEKFHVVFNHTTLEHIFDVNKAFENICRMAKEACILVVPFMQEVHVADAYKDYWRFTPFAMQRLYEQNGFSLVVCEYNNDFDTAVYLFCIGIRNEMMDKYPQFHRLVLTNENPAGNWLGNDSAIKKIYVKK